MKNVNVNELRAGMRVFIPKNGKMATITAVSGVQMSYDVRMDIQVNLIEQGTNNVYMGITPDQFEFYCGDIYKIGAKVQSVLGGGFMGRVVGYEPEVNRVVCLSNKVRQDSDNRVRYSYRLDELKPYEEEFTFELNHKYKVNGQNVVRAIEHPSEEDMFLLIRDDCGKIVTSTPKTVPMRALNVKGLLNIQPMK